MEPVRVLQLQSFSSSSSRDFLPDYMEGWEAKVGGKGEVVVVVVFLMIPQAQCLRECVLLAMSSPIHMLAFTKPPIHSSFQSSPTYCAHLSLILSDTHTTYFRTPSPFIPIPSPIPLPSIPSLVLSPPPLRFYCLPPKSGTQDDSFSTYNIPVNRSLERKVAQPINEMLA